MHVIPVSHEAEIESERKEDKDKARTILGSSGISAFQLRATLQLV